MTDAIENRGAGPTVVPGPRPGPVRDAAAALADGALGETLSALDALDDRPVTAHVAAFEAAHDALVAELARTED